MDKQQLIETIDRLNDQQQQELLEFAHQLLHKSEKKQRLARLAGTISEEDAGRMNSAIVENRIIDRNDW
ncbi:hypothetical protein [Tellurirhabdus rosea]|uniref:hypothetical protein n=1 Tax=Tellurirhabdus rosea TaxID=2674997 RepID=UPI002257E274|nr:hypothetical protein [Tellurirhabdus rosea]